MKKLFLGGWLCALSTVGLVTGCVERRVVYVESPPVVVAPQVVAVAPPVPPSEVIIAPPGPEYVWVPGYWSWQGRWVWIRGSWVIRPHPHALWVSGRWVHRGHGYVWIAGHWR